MVGGEGLKNIWKNKSAVQCHLLTFYFFYSGSQMWVCEPLGAHARTAGGLWNRYTDANARLNKKKSKIFII